MARLLGSGPTPISHTPGHVFPYGMTVAAYLCASSLFGGNRDKKFLLCV